MKKLLFILLVASCTSKPQHVFHDYEKEALERERNQYRIDSEFTVVTNAFVVCDTITHEYAVSIGKFLVRDTVPAHESAITGTISFLDYYSGEKKYTPYQANGFILVDTPQEKVFKSYLDAAQYVSRWSLNKNAFIESLAIVKRQKFVADSMAKISHRYVDCFYTFSGGPDTINLGGKLTK